MRKGGIWLPELPYYIKYPVFDKKLWYKEIVKYGPYIGGGESIEFIPEEAQILDLLGIF